MAAKRKSDGASDSKSKKSKPFSKPKPEEPSALPEPLEAGDDAAAATDAPAEKTPKKEKKDKKEKKEKKESGSKKRKADEVELTNGDDNETNNAKVKKEEGAADVKAPKAKKSKKAKKAAAEGDETAPAEGAEVAEGEKKNRWTVFVGNLPYTANPATIRQHFASVKPEKVRCLTKDGKENTCRGFAFVDFNNPTNMRTCLDKLHHTMFNDGLSSARKINVELTAGGGGNKSEHRKEKIKARNAELDVNRAKRIQKEAEQKRTAAGGEPAKPSDDGGMHPSRRAMLP
ncbi:hypothetical protein F5X68DRAFT_177085 [Plectosphaerella plurivora]|uniref:RRM domain-containing protein n=1 Tax=Plectosphaerella plurivora TaxID=936078 RepID=A0A9P8V2L6_9PEZI|nr:hypothetical protein F5X68DRAFT_177085 [Plectosphaerella plurivora]